MFLAREHLVYYQGLKHMREQRALGTFVTQLLPLRMEPRHHDSQSRPPRLTPRPPPSPTVTFWGHTFLPRCRILSILMPDIYLRVDFCFIMRPLESFLISL